MYLMNLDEEKKHLFLELELHLVKAEGDVNELEKAAVASQCKEMKIEDQGFENRLTLDEVLEGLTKCTDVEKRIVFIEMLAAVVGDDVYHGEEKAIVERLAETLGITEEDQKQAFAVIYKIKEGYEEFSKFVLG